MMGVGLRVTADCSMFWRFASQRVAKLPDHFMTENVFLLAEQHGLNGGVR